MDANLFPVLTETELRLPCHVTSVGGWAHQEVTRRAEGSPDFQWIQCLNGEGELRTEGDVLPVRPGQGMLLYPHRFHHYEPVKGPWEVRWVTFSGKQAGSMLEALGFPGSGVLTLAHPHLLLRRMEAIFQLAKFHSPLYSLQLSTEAYGLFMDLFANATAADVRSRQEHYDQLQPALAYIESHYQEAISLECITSQLQLSPQYTCSLFQQTLGMRPFEYVNRIRVRRAKELLLQQPELTVQEVGRLVGLEHASYFIKKFKEQEGVTPHAFRQLHGVLL